MAGDSFVKQNRRQQSPQRRRCAGAFHLKRPSACVRTLWARSKEKLIKSTEVSLLT